ncbi:histidine phosphatase family protein [Mucilaginibacter sp. BJC16-A38]|uniref:histidine phosphatase family protein n=1 Tax=Mucilaginibacter phenanthrenivorans TaxID=1234842 RepID=UPI0021588623|nr:histidine phosphatase family protein [Mucilaginibacter phenanthrenivorans]MCR8561929.1 histidine phosphatase family protein [Mucilaginibacter phenanthrenivorans]
MKKALLIIILFICGGPILCDSANAQNCTANFLGTKTLYKANKLKYTPAPAGYVPVFINHVNRHGARHLTKDVKTTSAYTLLIKADSLNVLTEKGKQLMQMVVALQKVEKGNTKNISAEGRDELKGLGERMYANYDNVFAGAINLNVAVTKEVRTEQSADAFLSGLKKRLKDSVAIKKTNDDTHLRFYDLSPAYKSFEDNIDESEPKLSLEKAANIDAINNAVTARFFTADFLSKLDDNAKSKFVSDVFGFATIVYSLAAEIKQAGFTTADLDFKSMFACDELATIGMLDSIDENLKKGPGTDNNGIQVRVAVPLLVDFINTADDFIRGKKFNAQLRFAHAETIAPFAALLQIADADRASKDPSKLGASWQASKVIPLSSNIQWVFYKRKNASSYLVKVLLNEQEVHITGLATKTIYYKWTDLCALYATKLTKLGVKLTDDMNVYLNTLK